MKGSSSLVDTTKQDILLERHYAVLMSQFKTQMLQKGKRHSSQIMECIMLVTPWKGTGFYVVGSGLAWTRGTGEMVTSADKIDLGLVERAQQCSSWCKNNH